MLHALLAPAAFAIISLSLAVPGTARASLPRAAQRARQSRGVRPRPLVREWPGKAKRWALVVGVDQYQDSQVGRLRGADNDAHSLRDALVRYAGFPEDQIVLLATDEPRERQPTRINILQRLSNLAKLVPPDGLLLVSFAGHGLERGGQAYLLPSDATLSDDISLLEESAVSVARVRDRVRAAGVRQVVFLLDACRNDPAGRADAPNLLSPAYVRGFDFDLRNREVQAFATIYATSVGQRAYEYAEKGQGYFTWAVVEGLKGGAADERGEVTLASLVGYVQEVVPKRIAVDLGGRQQRPFANIEGYKADELVVAVSAVAAEARPGVGARPADGAAVEIAYWDTVKESKDPGDFRAYLDKYPDGAFAQLARNRLVALTASARPADDAAAGRPRPAPARSYADSVSAGRLSMLSAKFDEAERILLAAVESDPAAPEAYEQLGKTYWYMASRDRGYFAKCEQAFRAAIGRGGTAEIRTWRRTKARGDKVTIRFSRSEIVIAKHDGAYGYGGKPSEMELLTGTGRANGGFLYFSFPRDAYKYFEPSGSAKSDTREIEIMALAYDELWQEIKLKDSDEYDDRARVLTSLFNAAKGGSKNF